MNLKRWLREGALAFLVLGLVLAASPTDFRARGAAPPLAPRPPRPAAPPRSTAPARPAVPRPRPSRPLPGRPLPPKPPKPVRLAARRHVVAHHDSVLTVVESADDLVTVAAPSTESVSAAAYKVARIADDHTPVLMIDGQEKKVRLISVAVPGVQGSAAAKYKEMADRFFRDLLVGEFVYLAYDSNVEREDESGAVVAYLYRAPDNLLVNLEVIRQGFGLAETDYYFDQQTAFQFYESKAQADDKGLWTLVEPSAPAPASAAAEPGAR